jgi:hypothetical protein
MPLSDEVVRNFKQNDKTVRLFDGGGMYLEVSPTGRKWWRLKYRFAGKENRLSLGIYPDVSLADARKRRDNFRALLSEGIDPSEYAKMEKAAQRADEARQIAATRFDLDDVGALSFRFGKHRVALTSAETAKLRDFLDATRAVIRKETPCP